ncbi:MAG: DUF4019 domain-containing protein [Desulfuromonadaceae bacterium]
MQRSTGIKVLVISLAVFLLTLAAFADPTKEKAAVGAAENFLQLIDSGQFAASWEVCSSLFKQQVPKQQWIRQLESILPTLGPLADRKLKSQQYTRSLPGAPDGEYVVIQFSSAFANKRNTLETVTPMLDRDGQWRVSGYYIR